MKMNKILNLSFWQKEITNMEKLEELHAQNIDWNMHDKEGTTPLFFALRAQQPHGIIERLLQYGAKVNVQTKGNKLTPLMYATYDAAVTRLLLDHGAKVKAETSADCFAGGKRRALDFAAAEAWDTEILRLLIDHGSKPNHTDADKETAFFASIQNNNVKAVRFWLDILDDKTKNMVNKEKKTVLDLARGNDKSKPALEILSLLEGKITKAKAEPNPFDVAELHVKLDLTDLPFKPALLAEIGRMELYTLDGEIQTQHKDQAKLLIGHAIRDPREPEGGDHPDDAKAFALFRTKAVITKDLRFEPTEPITETMLHNVSFGGLKGYELEISATDPDDDDDSDAIHYTYQCILNFPQYCCVIVSSKNPEHIEAVKQKLPTLQHHWETPDQDEDEDDNKVPAIHIWDHLHHVINEETIAAEYDTEFTLKMGNILLPCEIYFDEIDHEDIAACQQLMQDFCAQKTEIEQLLFDFTLEFFDDVDMGIDADTMRRITDDPAIIAAEHKERHQYYFDVYSTEDIIEKHSNINFYMEKIDEELCMNITFFSEWENEHGCVFEFDKEDGLRTH